jgi:hypothetical protein
VVRGEVVGEMTGWFVLPLSAFITVLAASPPNQPSSGGRSEASPIALFIDRRSMKGWTAARRHEGGSIPAIEIGADRGRRS